MRYLCLIYADEQTSPQPGTPEGMKSYGAYMDYTKLIKERGAYLGGERLQNVASATTIRIRNGEKLVTDGPFAETKEQLGGYYMLQARDLDEALELAAGIPGAQWGSIEVRPIFELG